MPATESLVKRWVDQYRTMGYQPLPSDPRPESEGGRKKPLISFSKYWEATIPGDPFARFDYETNIQVMTGCHWRLCVIDLDGPEAEEKWKEWTCERKTPKTWEVRSGSGGRHLWFAIPTGISMMPSGRIWSVWDTEAKDWKKHTAIELLADRKLVVAPPSKHPRTGNRYRWIKERSPYEMATCALCPQWIINLPILRPPSSPTPCNLDSATRNPSRSSLGRSGGPLTGTRSSAAANAQQILDSIPDKTSLAESWGLRVASRGSNESGWISVHAIGREDRNPSASFRPDSGRYWDTEVGGTGISFFALAARLGAYADPREAFNSLADQFLPRSTS